jgi:muramoyltetrapeptide carboxypeptidase
VSAGAVPRLLDAMSEWLFPPALSPGATVRVVAPCGPFESRLVWRGLGWLSERYRVRFDRGLFDTKGYLAGSDERRFEELRGALEEPDVHAVLCARGGYGASRFVHRIDWSVLRASPRWLVGFSDFTALHVEAQARAVASLHGPNVAGLGRGDAAARAQLVDALECPRKQRAIEGLASVVPGTVTGRLCGGNLTLLHACATAGRLALPHGTILLIEDVTERPYRIDRMLTTLLVGGHLRNVTGIVVGDFTDCEPGSDGVAAQQVIREILAPLGVPMVAGAAVGHGRYNQPVVLGELARIECSPAGASLRLGE